MVYGHRGTRRGAPENSLAAMQLALEQGADGIEIDVRLCQSGEVIVLHDPDLLRVAGVAYDVANLVLDDVLACDLGDGKRVPRLEQALDLVLGGGYVLNIELKTDVPDAVALSRCVVEQLQRRPPGELGRVVLSSFSPSVCRVLCAALPGCSVALLLETLDGPVPEGLRAVHPHHSLVTEALVRGWHQAGLGVNVWTVNDAEQARTLARFGVDGLITDDVPLVLDAL